MVRALGEHTHNPRAGKCRIGATHQDAVEAGPGAPGCSAVRRGPLPESVIGSTHEDVYKTAALRDGTGV